MLGTARVCKAVQGARLPLPTGDNEEVLVIVYDLEIHLFALLIPTCVLLEIIHRSDGARVDLLPLRHTRRETNLCVVVLGYFHPTLRSVLRGRDTLPCASPSPIGAAPSVCTRGLWRSSSPSYGHSIGAYPPHDGGQAPSILPLVACVLRTYNATLPVAEPNPNAPEVFAPVNPSGTRA